MAGCADSASRQNFVTGRSARHDLEVIDQVARTFDSRSSRSIRRYRKETSMTDHNTIARRYIELWNERTPTRRREMLERKLDGRRKHTSRPV